MGLVSRHHEVSAMAQLMLQEDSMMSGSKQCVVYSVLWIGQPV
jgi:hypothetical protein